MLEKSGNTGIGRRDLLAATAAGGLAGVAGSFLGRILFPVATGARAKRRIAIGILGQSNEQNRVSPSDIEAYPQAFQSIHNPVVRAPQLGNLVVPYVGTAKNGYTKKFQAFGGMWFSMYDALWEWGYDCVMVNGAIGSASMVRDVAGAVSDWRPNANLYFERRDPVGRGDNGFTGSFVVKGSPAKIFRCVRGARIFATFDGNAAVSAMKTDTLDYIQIVGGAKSGAQEPLWNSVKAVGDTLEDGDLLWIYERNNDLGISGALGRLGVCNSLMTRNFWDPLGIIRRLEAMMQSIDDVEEKWIFVQNGQSDYGGSEPARLAYQSSLENITQYCLDRGYNVAIGLSCFTPTETTSSWDGLDAARSAVLTTFNGSCAVQPPGSRVQPGGNLYRELGTSVVSYMQTDTVHLNGKGAIEAGKVWGQAARAFLPKSS